MKKNILILLFIVSKTFFASDFINKPEFADKVLETIKKESYININEQAFLAAGSIEEKLQTYLNNYDESQLFKQQEQNLSLESPKAGLGIKFKNLKINKNIYAIKVVDFFPNSPAQAAGLQIDNIIIAIDNIAIKDIKNIPQKITGEVGSSVIISILEGSTIKNISVLRKAYEVPRFASSIVGNIGIIEVRNLIKEHTANDFSSALNYFETQKIKKIVIDFRFNESADFDSGIKFMEQLLPNNSPLFIYKSKNKQQIFTTNNNLLQKRDLQFYVLQSSKAGGMSEIITRLLKKHFYTKVIGQKSQGYALISELVPVAHGLSIIVRKAEITDLNNNRWHTNTIFPDVVVARIDKINIKDANTLKNLLSKADKSLLSKL